MRLTSLILFFMGSLLATVGQSQIRQPLGERAEYVIDKSGGRTHNLIRSGEFNGIVAEYLPNAEAGPAYNIQLDYKFVISWFGTKEGSQALEVPEDYFSESFLNDLAANGTYEAEKFKMKHEGFADATIRNGTTYPNCHKVLIYDVDTGSNIDFAAAMLGMPSALRGDIENLEIRAHIYYGVPVLGAVKIDVSGDYDGMHVFAGADYTP